MREQADKTHLHTLSVEDRMQSQSFHLTWCPLLKQPVYFTGHPLGALCIDLTVSPEPFFSVNDCSLGLACGVHALLWARSHRQPFVQWTSRSLTNNSLNWDVFKIKSWKFYYIFMVLINVCSLVQTKRKQDFDVQDRTMSELRAPFPVLAVCLLYKNADRTGKI